MIERADLPRYALAALACAAVVGLALRLWGQVGDLGAARDDLADASGRVSALRAEAAAGLGPPLLDGVAARPADLLAQRLKALGFDVRQSALVAAAPAGRGAVLARFDAAGAADAAAIDRLALWAQANARSAVLETLTATAGDAGKSDVKLELDAIVRVAPQATRARTP
jgi:hypothetical protein